MIVPKSQIWVDSDVSEDDEGVNHETDFWRAINRDPDQLEHDANERHLKNASDLPQHINLTPAEIEQFLKFKQTLKENEEKAKAEATAAKINAEVGGKKAETAETPSKPVDELKGSGMSRCES